MHILERVKEKIGVQRRGKSDFMVVLSLVPVPYFEHSATIYLDPMNSGSRLNFYYLCSFYCDAIKIKASSLIYIPALDKVRKRQEALLRIYRDERLMGTRCPK